VKDILLPLPSYKTNANRGRELLQTICDRAKSSLKEDQRADADGAGRSNTTSSWVALAMHVVKEAQIGSPLPLFQFFLSSLLRGDILSSLPLEKQITLVADFTLLLILGGVPSEGSTTAARPVELAGVQRQTAEACPVIFQVGGRISNQH
jgi:hypothetical protein